jgi:cytoskeletal protein CcmA (bactofilin family)
MVEPKVQAAQTDVGSSSPASQEQKKQRATLVEEGTEFKGELTSNCPLVIRGKVEGSIKAPAITIARSGSLTGTAKIGQLLSEGELSGDFEADAVRLAGKIGNNTTIRARSLEAKLAAKEKGGLQVTFGECQLEVGEEPMDPFAHAADGKNGAPAATPSSTPAPAEAKKDDKAQAGQQPQKPKK